MLNVGDCEYYILHAVGHTILETVKRITEGANLQHLYFFVYSLVWTEADTRKSIKDNDSKDHHL